MLTFILVFFVAFLEFSIIKYMQFSLIYSAHKVYLISIMSLLYFLLFLNIQRIF